MDFQTLLENMVQNPDLLMSIAEACADKFGVSDLSAFLQSTEWTQRDDAIDVITETVSEMRPIKT